MESLPKELNVVTLNCWGLPHISRHRSERLLAIGRRLAVAEPVPHIVALQECWTREDYLTIRRQVRAILPFGKFYHSGAFGSGLAILSRWRLEESTMHKYTLNGRPTAFFRGDWFVGKGVACARIRYGNRPRDVVEVFNTHTHSSYGEAGRSADYLVHRLSQSWELSKLVRGATERGHLAIALGDLNDVPGSLPYRILSSHAPIRDVWRVLHPDSSLGAADDDLERARRRPVPTAYFNVAENGVTTQSAFNTWHWSKAMGGAACDTASGDSDEVPADAVDGSGRRIDYIFASNGSMSVTDGGEASGWVVKDASVGMVERHPDLQCSLSDHFAVQATFVLYSPKEGSIFSATTDQGVAIDDREAALDRGTYLSSPVPSMHQSARERAAYEEQLREARTEPEWLPGATYDGILSMVAEYKQRERRQQIFRALHWGFWVVFTLVAYITVWFVSPGGAFAFLLFSSLGLAMGTVDGLMALLFFGGELRALAEFEWEVRNTKSVAEGSAGLSVADSEKEW